MFCFRMASRRGFGLMFDDHFFGDQIRPEQRLDRRREDLTGVRHLHRKRPGIPQPDQPVELALTTSGPVPFDAARCWYEVERDRQPPTDDRQLLTMTPERSDWDTVEWGYLRQWVCTLPPQPTGSIVTYWLAAKIAGKNTWVFADNQARTQEEATRFAYWLDGGKVPAWAQEAVVYHVFVDRFYPGDGREWLKSKKLSGFFGGTLHGVTQKLDYIRSLGFNALWLSPVFASPSHHGYDGTDYYKVEPRLGTNADLGELIEQAHAREMRVILDFVANHWSHLHSTFVSARSDPHSPYHDWYLWIKWPDEYHCFLEVAKTLPQINLAPGPARDYMLECARYWLRQGVDGFRLDHAYGPPHDFWADFRQACRSEKPDCWLFGEVIHTAALQASYAGLLDGNLDFLLARALRETFARGTWTLAEFEAFLAGHEAYFPPEFSRPSFLDNHDMNRFLFAAGGDRERLKLAALVLFTLSGPPIVYYGTEVGLSQERPIHWEKRAKFEEARQPMLWGEQQELELAYYFGRLIALRHGHPVLREGPRRVVHLDSTIGTYAYVRESSADRVLIALNSSLMPRTLTIPGCTLARSARDQLYAHPVQANATSVIVELPGMSGAIIA